jgi:hypothetical protein
LAGDELFFNKNHFERNDLMKHPSLESDDNNDTLDPLDTMMADNSTHDENETTAKGAPLVKKKYKANLDKETVAANPLDIDLLAGIADVCPDEVVEVRRGKTVGDNDNVEPGLPRGIDPTIARQQIKDKLRDAMNDFTYVEAATPKIKEQTFEESWHIRDQITRGNLGNNDMKKARLLSTIRRLKSDCNLVTLDPLSASVHAPGKDSSTDFALQKDSYGNVVYEFGQSLDRRKAKRTREDGVVETRHYGSARKAKHSPVHEFNVHRDEPLSFLVTDATNNIEEIRAGLGPLWSIVEPVVCNNMKSAEVGYRFGKTDPQASAVGNVILQIAIEEVATIYRRIDQREASDLAYVEWLETQDDALAVPARRLKRALSPNQQSLVFRHNQPIKSMLLATNDNDSRYLAA